MPSAALHCAVREPFKSSAPQQVSAGSADDGKNLVTDFVNWSNYASRIMVSAETSSR